MASRASPFFGSKTETFMKPVPIYLFLQKYRKQSSYFASKWEANQQERDTLMTLCETFKFFHP